MNILEKTFKIIISNHKFSTAKATTEPCSYESHLHVLYIFHCLVPILSVSLSANSSLFHLNKTLSGFICRSPDTAGFSPVHNSTTQM